MQLPQVKFSTARCTLQAQLEITSALAHRKGKENKKERKRKEKKSRKRKEKKTIASRCEAGHLLFFTPPHSFVTLTHSRIHIHNTTGTTKNSSGMWQQNCEKWWKKGGAGAVTGIVF